jgi:hypothetical protein
MTTTPVTVDGPETVEQAEQHAAEAEQAAAALEERVREGDEEITPEQLTAARERGLFARLRAEAARRKAERAEAAAAAKQRADLLDQAAAITTPGGPLDADTLAATYATARDAVRAFVTASETYNATIGEAARLLAAAGVPDSTYASEHPALGAVARWGTDRFRTADGRSLYPTGTGLRLAVLLDDLDREFGGISTGDYQPPFTRTPITEQASRGRDTQPHLDRLAAEIGGTK